MTMKKGAGLIGALVLVSPSLKAALITIGSGSAVSYFTLQSPNIGVRQYAVRYDQATATPAGGSFLLDRIDQNDPDITFLLNDFGTASQPNEFFSAVTFNGVTESNDFSPGGSTFSHWVAGGEAGAAGLGVPDPEPIDNATWTLGAGLSVNFRLIADGSNDALVFAPSQTQPSVAPIPEASSSLLIALSLTFLLTRRKCGASLTK